MITTIDRGILGIEVICEPDDEYDYYRCASSVAGLFFIRVKNDALNVWVFKDEVGCWDEKEHHFSEMKNKDTVTITEVTEATSDLLPTKQQYYAAKNN